MSSPLTTAGRSALAWTPIAAAAIVVAVRVFVRTKLRTIGTEDYLMITSLLFALVSAALAVTSFQERPKSALEGAKIAAIAWLASLFASFSITFAKSSVGFLLLRLLGPTSQRQRCFLIITLILLPIIQVFQLISYLFPSCSSPRALQSSSGCVDNRLWVAFADMWNVYAIIVDVAYCVIPIALVHRLRMRRNKTIAIATLLGLGWTASIFTLIRLIASFNVFSSYQNQLITPLCVAMEQSLIMIAGSLATLLPLYQYWSKGKPLAPRGDWNSPTINNHGRHIPNFPNMKSSGGNSTKISTGSPIPRNDSVLDPTSPIRVDREVGVEYPRQSTEKSV